MTELPPGGRKQLNSSDSCNPIGVVFSVDLGCTRPRAEGQRKGSFSARVFQMAELELMAPGPLPGITAHSLATVSSDSGSGSPAEEEDLGSPGSPQEETEGSPASEGEAEVLCDFCLGTGRVKAVKSCLTCMVNYCEEHLRPHQENSKLHSHQLTEPVKDRDLRTCPAHRSPLVAFCRPDAQCICQECGQEEHKGHAWVSLDAARRDKEASAGVHPGGGGGEVVGAGRGWATAPGAAGLASVLLGPDKGSSPSAWLFLQGKYLLHLTLETEVGHSTPISDLLLLDCLCVCVPLSLMPAAYLSLTQPSVTDVCLGVGCRTCGA